MQRGQRGTLDANQRENKHTSYSVSGGEKHKRKRTTAAAATVSRFYCCRLISQVLLLVVMETGSQLAERRLLACRPGEINKWRSSVAVLPLPLGRTTQLKPGVCACRVREGTGRYISPDVVFLLSINVLYDRFLPSALISTPKRFLEYSYLLSASRGAARSFHSYCFHQLFPVMSDLPRFQDLIPYVQVS